MMRETRLQPSVDAGQGPFSSESVGRYLNEASVRLMEALDRQARGVGVSAAQWRVLIRIALDIDTTAADLCQNLRYDTGSMTRMLDRLENLGLIRRERSTEDRRVVRLSLTEEGEAICPRLQQIGIRVLDHFLGGFTQEEVVLLRDLLKRIASAPPLTN
ncbi:Transcriptional regulator, MarR family [Imhoffiella purpurea]|uniref:Transcriptional regulator, MarR family n=2 Tax=Imhoffiella purpurea TaxID=1249627 RepID=W9V7H6_9GAMM|nr:Transcriptional regulator, MarR family [Imhoffiella purpurea]